MTESLQDFCSCTNINDKIITTDKYNSNLKSNEV